MASCSYGHTGLPVPGLNVLLSRLDDDETTRVTSLSLSFHARHDQTASTAWQGDRASRSSSPHPTRGIPRDRSERGR